MRVTVASVPRSLRNQLWSLRATSDQQKTREQATCLPSGPEGDQGIGHYFPSGPNALCKTAKQDGTLSLPGHLAGSWTSGKGPDVLLWLSSLLQSLREQGGPGLVSPLRTQHSLKCLAKLALSFF